jgi:hypothetical protein
MAPWPTLCSTTVYGGLRDNVFNEHIPSFTFIGDMTLLYIIIIVLIMLVIVENIISSIMYMTQIYVIIFIVHSSIISATDTVLISL